MRIAECGMRSVKCGTSVGANYRASCRARYKADFISKMGIGEEECDETIYWMEILIESRIIYAKKIKNLMDEDN